LSKLVECHSGYLYAQRPTLFYWQGEKKLVEAVLDQWLTPTHRSFRVITPDQQIFELHFQLDIEDWEVIQP
jgi:hypothetical protein